MDRTESQLPTAIRQGPQTTSIVRDRPADLLAGCTDLLRLGRPLHLVGGLVFHALGLAVVHALGQTVRWDVAVWGQVAITSIQLMTHYTNDYFDQDADRANAAPTRWSGGSRVLVEERLPAAAALAAALVCVSSALAATVQLSRLVPNAAQSAGLLGLAVVLAWSYSGPPLALNRRGWGELTGAVLVPGLTVVVGSQLQLGRVDLLSILVALPLCFFQAAMLFAVNFPDAEGDAAVGKRTLVVQLGGRRAAQVAAGLIAAAWLPLPLYAALGLPRPAVMGILATVPIGMWQIRRLLAGGWQDPAAWDGLGFWSIGLLVLGALLEVVALVAGR